MATYAYDPYEDDQIAPGYGSAVAFDIPREDGLRYPIATPQAGTFDFGAVPSRLIRTPEQSQAAYDARDQYKMEMDRVLRNQIEESNPASVQDAVRLRGLLKFQQLTRDGMDSAAAIRMVAPELYFNHPQATAMATREIPSMSTPSLTTVPVGDNEALFVNGKYRTTLRTPAKKDPIGELESKEANEAVSQAMRELANVQKSSIPGLAPDAAAVEAARRNLEAARSLRRDVVRGVKTPAVPETKDDMVAVISPSGQRGRVPRSKLDAAKKAGYKVQ